MPADGFLQFAKSICQPRKILSAKSAADRTGLSSSRSQPSNSTAGEEGSEWSSASRGDFRLRFASRSTWLTTGGPGASPPSSTATPSAPAPRPTTATTPSTTSTPRSSRRPPKPPPSGSPPTTSPSRDGREFVSDGWHRVYDVVMSPCSAAQLMCRKVTFDGIYFVAEKWTC